MSLRTKILAAIVGLNLVVLLLGVGLLLLQQGPGDPSEVPDGVAQALARARADPGESLAPRYAALRDLAALPRVTEVILLQEESDGSLLTPQRRSIRPPHGLSKERDAVAIALVQQAFEQGRPVVRPWESAVVLDQGHRPDGRPTNPRQGAVVRWSQPAPAVATAQRVYVFVLVGVLLLTVVSWRLLSRLVVVPLGSLAGAADRIAGGDYAARVPTAGSGDEFDRTAQAFNRMAREVGEYQGQLEDRVLQALKRIQKAEQHLAIAQRLAATGKLASGIAHEINNPLGGMRNAVRALARGDLDPKKTAEYLELVQDGLARVEETVKKVLTFTPRSVEPRPTDLAEVARKAVALARHRIERKGVRLVEHVPWDRAVRVFGDPHELQQVVLNLLLNAVDAVPDLAARSPGGGTEGGAVELEVREEGDAVLLRVTDDGAGMTPEVMAQCFDLFFTTKEVGEGTGLGLAVVHNIVTNHGGRIEVESAPGKGATFRVYLPREGAAPDGSPEPETSVRGLRGAAPSQG
jgi:signal transduction histidine kinase